jgi:alkylation response protein AidB-like acyl-CoA dehydrogenase
MDFRLTDEQQALGELARRILEDRVTHDRLKAVEAGPEWFDRDAWAELAKAKLLGVAVPEDSGGSGLGLVELCLLLEQVGRTVAPVPAWPTLVLGALPIARFGTPGQRTALHHVAAGETVLSAALVEPGSDDPLRPETTAEHDGYIWRLDGVKTCVPAAHLAQSVLVPARTTDGELGVFVVHPHAAGVVLERQVATNREPLWHMELAGTEAESLGHGVHGDAILPWLVERALVGLCAMQLGVAGRALRMTAEHTLNRQQFDRPLASFQAVHQRAADAYIDVEAIRLTLWQAAWRLAEDLPAATEVHIAKFWASEAAHRVVYAAQHLHGGIGVDVDYPLHRYYLWAKQIELTLGSGSRQLAWLGSALASQ